MLQRRMAAKESKNFEMADNIAAELQAREIAL
jgi:cysteinyl-tRNA synthetase